MDNNKVLVELTEQTVDEVVRILSLSTSEYVKEYAVESERVQGAKIEKVQNMITTLRFFIKRSRGENADFLNRTMAAENTSEQIFPSTNE